MNIFVKLQILKLNFVESVICCEFLNVVGLTFFFPLSHVKSCCSKNCLLILIVVDRAYASFAVLVPFLKVVAVDKVANVLEFVDIKVAQRIESFNVAN